MKIERISLDFRWVYILTSKVWLYYAGELCKDGIILLAGMNNNGCFIKKMNLTFSYKITKSKLVKLCG